jgi:ATP-binding protein involved in chromosome partitioning
LLYTLCTGTLIIIRLNLSTFAGSIKILQVATKDQILKVLSGVIDPDFRQDIVSLGMVQDVEIEGNKIGFSVVLTTPACPLKEIIKNDCLTRLRDELGDDIEIDINITSRVTTSRDSHPLLPEVKNIIAVASGKGGVGKSTVTANLAVALARSGAKVGLIDADIFGPSIPTMFNCEHEQPEIIEKDGKAKIVPIEQYGVKLVSIGFLTNPEDAVVWRGPMASSALKQFISDAEWGELDYMLIDLPPGTSDIHLTLVQTLPVTGAVLVTTPQKVALADAIKGLQMFRQPQINVPILGVVENMSYFTPLELPENKYFIFGKDGGRNLAEKYKVPFLGEIPLVQGIRESGDSGYPSVLNNDISATAFKNLSEELARQIAIRNATVEKTRIVEIKTN